MVSMKLCQGPGSLLLTPLCDALVCMIPRSESELIQFQRSVEKPCKDFEIKLTTLGYLDATGKDSTGERGGGGERDSVGERGAGGGEEEEEEG